MGENFGKVVQVMGTVVDVEFSQGKLPTIYTALTITNPTINDEPDNLVIEVAQHLGDNVVRTIAMDVTDGPVRGMPVKDTGNPIMVPVGEAALGRVINESGYGKLDRSSFPFIDSLLKQFLKSSFIVELVRA